MDHTSDGSGGAGAPSEGSGRAEVEPRSDEHKPSVSVIRLAPRPPPAAEPPAAEHVLDPAAPRISKPAEPSPAVAAPAPEIRVPARDTPAPVQPRRSRTLRLLAGAGAMLLLGWWVGLNTRTLDAATIMASMYQSFGSLGAGVLSTGRGLQDGIVRLIPPSADGVPANQSASSDRLPTTESLERAVRELTTKVDQLQGSPAGQVRELKAEVDTLRASVERAQAELASRLTQAVERVERLEQARTGPRVTGPAQRPEPAAGVVPGQTAPTAVQRPVPAGQSPGSSPAPNSGDQTVLRQWTVREVLNGTAVLQGPSGLVGVSPGQTVPGLGRVEAITRQGGGWVVATSRGIVRSTEATR